MGANTAISWTGDPHAEGAARTGYTFNPWWGCVKVSPGCKNCYAADLAGRFGQGWTPTSERRFMTAAWSEPPKWNRAARKAGKPGFVFCASMADIFEDEPEHVRAETEAARVRLWALIDATPWLVWLLLTKRPERVAQVVPAPWMAGGWPPNVWIGCTVEDQEHAEKRLPHLLGLPAPRRFVSYEPALGPVNWSGLPAGNLGVFDALRCGFRDDSDPADEFLPHPTFRPIDWIIIGGESGPKARPFRLAWARTTIRQCQEAGVPVWMKQLGYRAEDEVNGLAGAGLVVPAEAVALVSRRLHHKAGADPDEWPDDLRVQERPAPLPVRGEP